MSVYVDSASHVYGRMLMCHMMADTTEELLAMADRIGVARKWIQKAGQPDEHFDVCQAKRRLAVAAGAISLASSRELIPIVRRKRAATGGNRG